MSCHRETSDVNITSPHHVFEKKVIYRKNPPAARMDFVDIHCHCLYGLDDGPSRLSESLRLCVMLANQGVRVVVATPHQMGRYGLRNDSNTIRRAVDGLNEELQQRGIPLNVLAGADVHVDERLCELLKQDRILTVADNGKYLLFELPFEVFIDIEPLLAQLREAGIDVIISHPERYMFPVISETVLRRWSRYAFSFQLNAGSFWGDFGERAQALAWHYLQTPVPCCIATDAHDTVHRKPRFRQGYNLIAQKLGEQVAVVVCMENPRRIIEGEILLSHGDFWRGRL